MVLVTDTGRCTAPRKFGDHYFHESLSSCLPAPSWVGDDRWDRRRDTSAPSSETPPRGGVVPDVRPDLGRGSPRNVEVDLGDRVLHDVIGQLV